MFNFVRVQGRRPNFKSRKQTCEKTPDFMHFLRQSRMTGIAKNQLAGYEGYYASIFYCYFIALGLEVTAEDTTSKGRIDLTVRLDNNIYIIEFKVISMESSAGSALKQIKEKNYHEKFKQKGLTTYIIGVEFNKEDRNITGFEWERI